MTVEIALTEGAGGSVEIIDNVSGIERKDSGVCFAYSKETAVTGQFKLAVLFVPYTSLAYYETTA